MYQKSIKLFSLFCILTLILCGMPFSATADETVSVSAKAAVLMTADSLDVLYDKSADERLSMASTTKIMTGLLALEKLEREGDTALTITQEMVAVEGSSMGLRADDRLSVEGIVMGLMLASGNDAANAIAYYVGGSPEGFAEIMNARAEEIGMENSSFVTPSGLDDDEHYTTAYDMALLTAVALKNERFREIVSTKSGTVDFEEPEKTVWYSNHNKLLKTYDGAIGVKTGFTDKSGRCLVSAAERDGVTLICVTLDAPDDWNDHAKMLDYGFENTVKVLLSDTNLSGTIASVGDETGRLQVKGNSTGYVTVGKDQVANIQKTVCLPRFVYAPISGGDTVGYVGYYLNDRLIGTVDITAAESISYKEKEGFFENLFG